jgi:hypothetical protein
MPNVNVRKFECAAWLIVAAALCLAPEIRAQPSSTVRVAYSTADTTPLNQGFAGFACEMLDTGLRYDNTNFQKLVTSLSPGWIRYPSGISDDAFDWATGLTDTNWINILGSYDDTVGSNSCTYTYLPLLGKGGAQFTNFASMTANVGGARIIVVLNCFTDTTNSAGAFAAFALSNHISVAAWELCNEPYNFTSGASNFFNNGTDYANKMLPYRNAVKAADSNAVVAVFYSDPGRGGNDWDNALDRYTNKYWDAVSYHYYPTPALTNFSDLMAYDNGVLLSNTSVFVSNNLVASNLPGTTFMITEFQPVAGSGAGTTDQHQNLPSASLYGGIYASEFIMRMSTVPQMKYVGNFQLFNANGIYATNVYRSAAVDAADGGYITNTQNLPFGFYLSAQVTAEAVAYWAVNRSTALYATTVDTNGPTVPINTNYDATMPAIYAQAYQGGNGKRYVVLTNKGSNAAPVQIVENGFVLTNSFLETFVTGADPSTTNASPEVSPVGIQTQTASNPVTIPEYSVVRLEWTVFQVPPPALALTASNPARILGWTGLTNVTYDVQVATNLNGTWATLGKVSSTQTNFSFTDLNNNNSLRFYRLVVP